MIRTDSIPAATASLLSLALIAGCASSPEETATSAEYTSIEQLEGDPDRMVCKTKQETGSRLSSRVCKTARESEQERLDNQEAIRNATRSGMPPDNIPTAGGG